MSHTSWVAMYPILPPALTQEEMAVHSDILLRWMLALRVETLNHHCLWNDGEFPSTHGQANDIPSCR